MNPITYTVYPANSTLTINDDLNKSYDGAPIATPEDFTTTGTSAHDYKGQWYKLENNVEIPLPEAPVNQGTYRYKVTVSGDKNFNGTTGYKDFTISTADNEWTTPLSITGWEYKQTANRPFAESRFGTNTIQYRYYDAEKNEISPADVKNAGDYYVKAIVPADAEYKNYKEMESDFVPFKITKAQNSVDFVNSNLDMVYTGKKVADPEVSQVAEGEDVATPEYRWQQLNSKNEWVDLKEAPVHAGHYKVIVTLPENTNYLSATNEKTFDITQATNKWTKALSMTSWVYGEQENDPVAVSKFGNVKFTYSRFEDKDFVTAKPTAPGKWYVKAEVAETADYTGLTSKAVAFYITNSDVLKYFTIDAKSGENGTISPTGNAIVKEQSTWTYTITPNEGYEVANVLVDGKRVGAVTSYTFSKVDRDHTIEASFKEIKKEEPQKDVSIDENGNITLSGADLNNTTDDIKISTGKDGVRPTYNEAEKTVTTADGSVISRPGLTDITAGAGWKVAFDGTVTDTDGNVYKTDGKVYGTDGSVKNADGSYAQPAKPMIESAEAVKNSVNVVLSDDCAGAEGYDYVIGTSADMLQTKQYTKVLKNKTTETSFNFVDEGTWYVACHAWTKNAEGKKVFGTWSEVKEVKVTSVTPQTPKIQKVTVKDSSVTVTYTECENADGYDLVLGTELNASKLPAGTDKIVKKVKGTTTVTVTFKNVKSGTYYLALHAWNRTSDDNTKIFSNWSNVKTVKVK